MTLKNFLLDLLIFIAALIAFEPRLTGIPVHEWLSLALGITLTVHLLWHWDWMLNVGKRYFKRLFHISRLKFFVDLLFLVAFITVLLSGLLISRSILPLFGIQTEHRSIWRPLHSLSADLSLLFLAIHLGLNWDWIVCTLKRYLWTPLRRGFSSLLTPSNIEGELCPQPVEETNRR
ncbi:MAG: hypothetical protein DDG59_09300 [Anaerolineae bacterium]|jgi:hypothetical protein|nr:MAG: hypothetical protein DDG59_09300 [Anaerolineae bacterium]